MGQYMELCKDEKIIGFSITSQSSTTVWYIPDAIQFALKNNGLEKIEKIIGALGSMSKGAVIGGTVGGPIGLLVGGLKGIVSWLVGEVICGFIFEIILNIFL